MKCAACGYENGNPVFEPIYFKVDILSQFETQPERLIEYPIRWRCESCGRYHFKDGTLYDVDEAKRRYRPSTSHQKEEG